MTSKLSVVIPTRNRARSLLRAAASVLAQDVTALELVVVDDASDDDTAAALDRLAGADARVRVVRNDADPLGPCLARNRGLEVAQGELVGFCDDDDLWLPGTAAAMFDCLEAQPGLSAVSGWHLVAHAATGRRAVFRGPTRYDARQLLWQNLVAVPFGIVRRSSVPFEVRFDPDLLVAEDWDLWLRCALERPVTTVPRVSYVYTQHGGARVTVTAGAQIAARRNFLSKYGDEMTGACRLYHETILQGYEHGRQAMMGRLRRAGTAHPVDATLAGVTLAASKLSSRLGQRRADPGFQARTMASIVRRIDRRSHRAV